MTQTVPAPTATEAPTRAGFLRRHRAMLVVAAALVVATILVIVGGGQNTSSAPLDPRNPDPAGAQAVAKVLEDEGVDVEIVRSADAFESTDLSEDSQVVVTSTDSLGDSTVSRLLDHAGETPVLLVEPGPSVLPLFGGGGGVPVEVNKPIAADCTDTRFEGLEIRVDSATAYPSSGATCFPNGSGSLVASAGEGLELLGAGAILENDQITREGNAATALRLLGERDHLVWYVPDLRDLAAGDGVDLGSLLPDWLMPGLWLLAITMIAVIIWRGRRFGPLVSEPMPVVVTAIETTRSRGRLYRKVNDRRHAAEGLRRAARSRIAERLRLPRTAATDADVLIRDVARHTQRPVEHVHALLSPQGPVPGSDKDLIHLANDLAELDREVRRT